MDLGSIDQNQADAAAFPYERILCVMGLGSDDPKYLVKYKNRSYRDSQWERGSVIGATSQGSSFITRWLKTFPDGPPTSPQFDPEYKIVDRIIKKEGEQYFVKWRNLDYDQCTWETDLEPHDIAAYELRQSVKFPLPCGDLDEVSGIQVPVDTEIYKKYGVPENYWPYLDFLFSEFCQRINTQVVDEYKLSLRPAIAHFFAILAAEYNVPGPFLIVSHQPSVHLWYLAFRDIPNLTAVLYSGQKDSRKRAKDFEYEREDGTLGFHVMITTPEIYMNDYYIFTVLNWRVYVNNVILSQKARTQPKFSKLVNQSKIYHKITVHLKKLTNSAADIYRLADLLCTEEGSQSAGYEAEIAQSIRDAVKSKLSVKDLEPVPESVKIRTISAPLNKIEAYVIRKLLYEKKSDVLSGDAVPACNLVYKAMINPLLIDSQLSYLDDYNFYSVSTRFAIVKKLVDNHPDKKIVVLSKFSLVLDYLTDTGIHVDAICLTKLEILEDLLNHDIAVFLDGNPPEITPTMLSLLKEVYVLKNPVLDDDLFENVFLEKQTTDFVHLLTLATRASFTIAREVDPQHLLDQEAYSRPVDIDLGISEHEFLEQTLKEPPKTHPEVLYEQKWTEAYKSKFIRALSMSSLEQLRDFNRISHIPVSDDSMKAAIRFILTKMLFFASTKRPLTHVRAFNAELASLDNVDLGLSSFSDESFLTYIKTISSRTLKQLETLFNIGDVNSIRDTGQFKGIPAPPNWSFDLDRAFLRGFQKYGFGRFDRFCEDEDPDIRLAGAISFIPDEARKLKDRFFRISDLVKQQQVTKQAQEGDIRRQDITVVLKYLRDHGVDEDEEGNYDFESFQAHLGLKDYDSEQLKTWVTAYIENAGESSSSGTTTKKKVIKNVNVSHLIRKLFRGRTEQEQVEHIKLFKPWKLMPESFTPEIEVQFYKLLLEEGYENLGAIDERLFSPPSFEKIPTPVKQYPMILARLTELTGQPPTPQDLAQEALNPPKKRQVVRTSAAKKIVVKPKLDEVKFPLRVSDCAIIESLGTIITDRPGFHTNRYIYPVGYTVKYEYSSLKNSLHKTSWKCEIIDTGGAHPLFRVTAADDNAFMFEGLTPSAPWHQIEARFKAVNTILPKPVPNGNEAFLFSSTKVMALIKSLQGVSSLPNFSGNKSAN